MSERIVGIDLGTTNSEIAAYLGDNVEVLGRGEAKMLPSCVGISPAGDLLIGEAARNMQLVYPERTVRSVKRRMGSADTVSLGEKKFTPQEISALILRELARWAEERLGAPVTKAVITVPAYFSDAQRSATREAGALAGLEVVRIVNEPTAASLAYGCDGEHAQTVMVYDLGGGTFDVSIVTLEGDVTEVLASHGNNRLGGDDFNELLLKRLLSEFRERHGVDLEDGHPAAYSRLWWAAEEAKKKLSFEPYMTVREEALVVDGGKPLNLELELTRDEYEDLIRPLVESTWESAARAMQDAGKLSADIDRVLLVGGATRTPLVSGLIEERLGIAPRQDVHPDLCVALGAGLLAARVSGEEVERILVDVSPYSFGPSYLGERDGDLYRHCYQPIIRRNTPLPVTRTETYSTAFPYQSIVQIDVYQGEDPDALKNLHVGNFQVRDLQPTEEPNEVLCRMSLDLDGVLQVTATEKRTGKSKQITIEGALERKTEAQIAAARQRVEHLFAAREGALGVDDAEQVVLDVTARPVESTSDERTDEKTDERARAPVDGAGATVDSAGEAPEASTWSLAAAEASGLAERVRGLLERMHPEDQEEAIDLNDRVQLALEARDGGRLTEAVKDLKELLFFVDGNA